MDAYTNFSRVYDRFMDNVPYEEWSDYVDSVLKEYGIKSGPILDLGCGTGSFTELLARKGYDMIGIDSSVDMLDIAMKKRLKSGYDILYLLQDMREFELYGTVQAVISICDSINYILDYEDLVKTFSLVNNYLDPNGIFLFDLNTEYKYSILLGDRTIAENREEESFIWENYYYPKEHINEYVLTLFLKESDRLYQKFEETHYQRSYSLQDAKRALDQSGLIFLDAYDAFTKKPPQATSERLTILARESGKLF